MTSIDHKSLDRRRAGFSFAPVWPWPERRKTRTPGRSLFLISPSKTPCGVENFARRLAQSFGALGYDAPDVAVQGAAADLSAIWSGLQKVDALVLNFPLVAWKKVLLTPLAAFLMARLAGKATVMILHEWGDLDCRRRAILCVYALFAQHIMFSSPMVRVQFQRSRFGYWVGRMLQISTSIAPIPSTVALTQLNAASALAARLREERAKGKFILGNFGSIYPKKHSDVAMDVAAELKRQGHDVFTVFIGSFIKGHDSVERDFYDKARRLGFGDADILVAGYIESDADIAAAFAEVDCFVYRFSEGLSSRRGSVLACAQSGKRVIVNAPARAGEFDHHRAYRSALDSGALCLVESDADAARYAQLALSSPSVAPPPSEDIFDLAWRDAAITLSQTLTTLGARKTAHQASVRASRAGA